MYELLLSVHSYLSNVLEQAAQSLNVGHTAEEGGLDHVLKEMPRLDLGTVSLDLRFNLLMALGERVARMRVEKELRKQMEPALTNALGSHVKLLEAWSARVLDELQRRFGERADWYRAYIARQTGGSEISADERNAVRLSLHRLRQWHKQAEPGSAPVVKA